MPKNILFFSCLLFLLISCKPLKKNTAEPIPAPKEDQVVFLLFKMSKDSVTGQHEVSLLRKTQSTGKIKHNGPSESASKNYLVIDVLENNQVKRTWTMDHPLFKDFEYMDENNALSIKQVRLDSADFFIRLQSNGKETIRISEQLSETKQRELINLKL